MKNKMKTLSRIILLIAFLFNSGGKIFGQDKVNLSLGIGWTEVINLGIKYQILNQAQIGLNFGWYPETEANGWLLSIQGNFYYHFFGKSKFSDLHPWYGRIGLNYLRDDFWGSGSVNWWYSHLRFGRDIYFSNKLGISLDAGLYYHLNPDITGNLKFGPSMGACFFYRF